MAALRVGTFFIGTVMSVSALAVPGCGSFSASSSSPSSTDAGVAHDAEGPAPSDGGAEDVAIPDSALSDGGLGRWCARPEQANLFACFDFDSEDPLVQGFSGTQAANKLTREQADAFSMPASLAIESKADNELPYADLNGIPTVVSNYIRLSLAFRIVSRGLGTMLVMSLTQETSRSILVYADTDSVYVKEYDNGTASFQTDNLSGDFSKWRQLTIELSNLSMPDSHLRIVLDGTLVVDRKTKFSWLAQSYKFRAGFGQIFTGLNSTRRCLFDNIAIANTK